MMFLGGTILYQRERGRKVGYENTVAVEWLGWGKPYVRVYLFLKFPKSGTAKLYANGCKTDFYFKWKKVLNGNT
jgi:hypothetical protein